MKRKEFIKSGFTLASGLTIGSTLLASNVNIKIEEEEKKLQLSSK